MASPTLNSICCLLQPDTVYPIKQLAPYFLSPSFSATSLVFSLLGVCGAVHQILQSYVIVWRAERSNKPIAVRVRYVLLWLATADLVANAAVAVRSVTWLADVSLANHMSRVGFVTSQLCVITSVLSQCCYLTTYMCTLLYTVEVLLTALGKSGSLLLYALIAWPLPALLSLIGCLLLYLPDNRCHARASEENTFYRHLPNYICVYVPLFGVMTAAPLIVAAALRQLRRRIVNTHTRFGRRERHTLLCLRVKLVGVWLGFCVCWLPNVAAGLLVWLSWPRLPVSTLAIFWYLMVAVNPLQALFNALMHRSWEPGLPSVTDWLLQLWRARTWSCRLCCLSCCHSCCHSCCCRAADDDGAVSVVTASSVANSSERVPLLAGCGDQQLSTPAIQHGTQYRAC